MLIRPNIRVGSKTGLLGRRLDVCFASMRHIADDRLHVRFVPSAVISAYQFTCSGSTDVRDFVHIAECVDWAVLALTRKFDSTLIRQ
jgi:hypothetical protein